MSIETGTEAMLTRRREILAQGAEPLGWKVGFNVPEIQQKLGIDAPLAGFLTTDSLIEGEWDEYPVVVESEVAVEIGDDGRSIAALRPGERIITGVLAPPHEAQEGDTVRLELEALGGVELRFS